MGRKRLIFKFFLVGGAITSFIVDPPEAVMAFLKTCSRTRESSPGRLTIKRKGMAGNDYLFEGSLVEPRNGTLPALLILRFQPQASARLSFLALNQKIDELTAEIARRKRLESERTALLTSEKAARVLAEQVSRTKDEFLAIVSHELRAGFHEHLTKPVEAQRLIEVAATLGKKPK